MKNVLRFWRLIVWALLACALVWVLVFEKGNPRSTSYLIALVVGAAVFLIGTTLLDLRNHRERESEMDAVDELMSRKDKQPFDKDR